MSLSAAVTADGRSSEFEDGGTDEDGELELAEEPEDGDAAAVEALAGVGGFAVETDGLTDETAGAEEAAETGDAPGEEDERTPAGSPRASACAEVHAGAAAEPAEAPAERAETGVKSIAKANKMTGNSRDMKSASRIG